MDVKMEGVELPIKADPDAATPASVLDDDDYEDTGELEFPKENAQAWLTRVPKVLWDRWSKIDLDEEIQLGTIRYFPNSKTYKLILNTSAQQNEQLPKEFDMRVMDDQARNTFVFSEKDLPGYNAKNRNGKKADPPLSARDETLAVLDPKSRIDKSRRQQFYRKSIPKRTTLAATIDREMHCIAAEGQEFGNLIKARMDAEARSKQGIQFINDDVGTTSQMVLPSSVAGGSGAGGFNKFISTGAKPGRLKPQENKTARIPQNDLLDLLHERFKKFKYWPLKALKAELKQPESYLKETLGLIATLVKSGPFALTYKLTDDNLILQNLPDEIAPADGASDAEDDDLEMEDAM